MAHGDHIYVKRMLYTHHGIDCGDGRVIHFTGTPSSKRHARVAIDTLEDFLDGGVPLVRHYSLCLPPEETVRNAMSRIGTDGYSLFRFNCEHFASWCKTGEHESKQVNNGRLGVAVGLGPLGLLGVVVPALSVVTLGVQLVAALSLRSVLDERDAASDRSRE